MVRICLKPLFSFVAAAVAIGVSAFVSQYVWREGGLKSLQAINEQRVQLVAGAVKAEIGRQDHLPFVLSLDPDVHGALAAPQDVTRLDQLNRKLTRFSREADTRALYVIGPDGTVVASDDWQSPDTLVGRNLADRPYFSTAVDAGESSYLGVDPGSNRVRYYLAQAVNERLVAGDRGRPHRVRLRSRPLGREPGSGFSSPIPRESCSWPAIPSTSIASWHRDRSRHEAITRTSCIIPASWQARSIPPSSSGAAPIPSSGCARRAMIPPICTGPWCCPTTAGPSIA